MKLIGRIQVESKVTYVEIVIEDRGICYKWWVSLTIMRGIMGMTIRGFQSIETNLYLISSSVFC
jgi:hypothetical protein